jgi:diguanylate cyclase (GGDEF)-like protein/PAS domain S-box-containing protein
MRDRWAAPAVVVVFTATYLGATVLGLGLSLPGSGVAAFWPAAGVAVAALVRAPRRWWPGLLGGMVLADVVGNLTDHRSIQLSLGVAAANVIEATVVATLVRRWTTDRRLRTPGDLVLGLVLPAVVGCAAGASLGAFVLRASSEMGLAEAFRAWSIGDLVGIITVAPIALVTRWLPKTRRDAVSLILPALVVAANVVSFTRSPDESFAVTGARLSVAGLLIVAARAPLQITAVTATAITSFAVWSTARGNGPFVTATVVQADLDAVHTVVVVIVLGALALGASCARARAADVRLRSLIDHLPHGAMVLERVPAVGPGAPLRPTYANAAMLQLFAATDVDSLGRLIAAAVTPEDRALGEGRAAAVADGNAPTAAGTMHVVVADGTERDIDWSLVDVVGDDGTRSVLAQAVDVTAARIVERELRVSEERFRLLAEHAPVGILLTDEHGAATSVNGEWRRMAGATGPDEDTGRLWVQRIHPDDRAELSEGFRMAIAAGISYEADYRLVAADGTVRWVAGTAVPIFGDDGKLRGMVGTALDVSERKRHEEDLARRALHDGLTGLPNRQHFEDRLRVALSELDGRRSLSVLFVDLDGFKIVNDTLGHDAGDLVLCEVASRLAEVVRPPDVVARLGGDEFAVLCVGPPYGSDPGALVGRLRSRVSEHLGVCGVDITVGVSIGIAATTDRHTEVGQLLRAADRSMYDSKRSTPTPTR